MKGWAILLGALAAGITFNLVLWPGLLGEEWVRRHGVSFAIVAILAVALPVVASAAIVASRVTSRRFMNGTLASLAGWPFAFIGFTVVDLGILKAGEGPGYDGMEVVVPFFMCALGTILSPIAGVLSGGIGRALDAIRNDGGGVPDPGASKAEDESPE